MKWDKKLHKFGMVKLTSTHYCTFKYEGVEELSNTNFIVSCSCTTPTYNPDTKELKVGLYMGEIGQKNASISIKKDGVIMDILGLQATIIQ